MRYLTGDSKEARHTSYEIALEPAASLGGNPAAMRLRLDDLTLLDDVRSHFERSGFAVDRAGAGALDVRRPDAPSAEQENREVELHLKLWQAMHPEAAVRLEDAPSP